MNIYQHFRPEEKEFIDQVLEWKNYVESSYSPKLTDFLDPREQHILSVIIGENGEIKYQFFGGTSEVERKRAVLVPEYLVTTESDFNISLFEIDYPAKFVAIEHRQVLGTLLSIGLKRSKFGDILMEDGRVQFFAANEIADFIKLNVESIGRAGVKLREIDLAKTIATNSIWIENTLTVSSLRLDTLVSGIHHLSRQKSQDIIRHGLVKVNWTLIENPSFECGEGDMISVRGYGRAKILSIEGQTKKEKWRINVGNQK